LVVPNGQATGLAAQAPQRYELVEKPDMLHLREMKIKLFWAER